MRMFARQITAVLIVAWSLFLSAAPIVQAMAVANDSCSCCKRSAGKCSYRTHHSDGPAIDALPDCYQGCAQAPGVPPPHWLLLRSGKPCTIHFSCGCEIARGP